MSDAPLCRVFLHLCVLFTTASAYYISNIIQCETDSSLQGMRLILSMMYNKQNFLSYDSSEMEIIGYGEYGLKWAEDLNKNPMLLKMETAKALAECQLYGQLILLAANKTVEPQVVLRSLRSESSPDPTTLICSAYDYYPRGIKVTWLIDGEPITVNVSSTDELSNGDWHYQIHSQLEHRPTPDEKISCKVEHQSLTRPVIYTWDTSLPAAERFKLGVGVAALVTGFITAASGLLYYYIKESGWTPVRTIEFSCII
ncbi:rano class II histocompatibility antigen, A beta chain-like [Trichomycterus rosablanca]|uniref:rano class II histocompatibility antigen, A beta chain-like n=1 Tax=Trichomycterus rosablanca TaxID=2290929 RepID=UPI002F350E9F